MTSTLVRLKDIRDKAITLQELAKRQSLGLKMQNDLAEIRLYAERRAGEILKETTRKPEQGRPKKVSNEPTLKDIGITRDQSSNWQRIADIPEENFIQYRI